jgi:hypothetical protein
MRPRSGALPLSLVLCASCGNQRTSTLLPKGPTSTPTSAAVSTVADACPSLEPTHLDGDGGQAYICSTDFRDVAGDGQWEYSVVQHVTGGLQALLDVYATKDAKIPADTACTAELPAPLVLWLHGSDVTAVRAPRDACNKPTLEARAAYDALQLTEVSSTKLRRITSQQSIDLGCSDQYKDMLTVYAQDRSQKSSKPHAEPIAVGSRTCVYDVKPGQGNTPVGELRTGHALTAAEVSSINAQLPEAAVDPSCTRIGHSSFALVAGPRSSELLVALHGCAVQQGGDYWRASEKLRTLLSH